MSRKTFWLKSLVVFVAFSVLSLGYVQAQCTPGQVLQCDPGGSGTPVDSVITQDPETGNVGIGTLNPQATLHVAGGTQIDLSPSGGGRLVIGNNPNDNKIYLGGYSRNGFGNADEMLITGRFGDRLPRFTVIADTMYFSGNVGIGTPDPQLRLAVQGSSSFGVAEIIGNGINAESTIGFRSSNIGRGSIGNWVMGVNGGGVPTGAFSLFSSGTGQVLTARTNGNVGIGTLFPTVKLDVAGQVRATQYLTGSDLRLKKNVAPLTGVLERLEKVQGVSFEWNELAEAMGHSSDRREIGVIAQEVEAVFPEVVTVTGEEGYKAVAYDKLTAVLIEAVKELKAKNDAAVKELKAENDALKQRLEALESK